MNQETELKNIQDFVTGKANTTKYTFVALKPSQTNLTAISVVLESLANAENDYEIAYHAPAIYTKENVQTHYKEIYDGYVQDPEGKFKFYPSLEEYLTRGPIYGLVIKGDNAVKSVKTLCGATKDPAPGTMRHELFRRLNTPYIINENGIHASGEINEAQREIANFVSASLVFPKENESLKAITDYVNSYGLSKVKE